MTAKGHLFLALVPTQIIVYNIINDYKAQTLFLTGAALGSLIPDIDEPRSYIGMKLPYLSVPLKLLGIRHRTFTHSIWFMVIFLMVAFLFKSIFLYGVSLGILMHLIGDMLTKGGVPLLYPISDKHYRLLPKNLAFYTNSLTEHLLVAILVLVNIGIFYVYNNWRVLYG